MTGWFVLHNKFRNRNGQIATLFTLIIAIVFLFVMVIVNLAETSRIKTTASRAAQQGALTAGSYMSSYARALFVSNDDKVIDCETNQSVIQAVIKFMAELIITLLAAVTQQWYAVVLMVAGMALDMYMTREATKQAEKEFGAAVRKMRAMPLVDQIRETAIFSMLMNSVADVELVVDDPDFDEDEDRSDMVGRFSYWYNTRVIDLIEGLYSSPLWQATQTVKNTARTLYFNLLRLPGYEDDYTLWYFDEESRKNKWGPYSLTPPDNGKGYLDEEGGFSLTASNNDFISLLYDIKYGKYYESGDPVFATMGDYIDFWVTPMIPEPASFLSESIPFEEAGDSVDSFLLDLRGRLEAPLDGIASLLGMLAKANVRNLIATKRIWFYPLCDTCDDFYLTSGEAGKKFDRLLIWAWPGFVEQPEEENPDVGLFYWTEQLYGIRMKVRRHLELSSTTDPDSMVDPSFVIPDPEMTPQSLISPEARELGEELVVRLGAAIENLETIQTHLIDFLTALQTFEAAYRPLHTGEETYKPTDVDTAIYSWKAKNAIGEDEYGYTIYQTAWHHVRVRMLSSLELPYLEQYFEGFLDRKICSELMNYSGDVDVDVTIFDPGSAVDFNIAQVGSLKNMLWRFRYRQDGGMSPYGGSTPSIDEWEDAHLDEEIFLNAAFDGEDIDGDGYIDIPGFDTNQNGVIDIEEEAEHGDNLNAYRNMLLDAYGFKSQSSAHYSYTTNSPRLQ